MVKTTAYYKTNVKFTRCGYAIPYHGSKINIQKLSKFGHLACRNTLKASREVKDFANSLLRRTNAQQSTLADGVKQSGIRY